MAPPKNAKWVQGTCACGHEGRQLEPDICGNCRRDRDRGPRPNRNRSIEVAVQQAPARVLAIMKKFKQLPFEFQVEVLGKINAAMEQRNS